MAEARAQKLVVQYLRDRGHLFTAPCNGANTGPREKNKLKQLGLEPGVPDLLIFTRSPLNPQYRGLAIEMKAPGGVVSDRQRAYVTRLQEAGWLAEVCYSAEDAIDLVEAYMELRLGLVDQCAALEASDSIVCADARQCEDDS